MRFRLWMIPLGMVGIPALVVVSWRLYGLRSGKTSLQAARERFRTVTKLPLGSPHIRIHKASRNLEIWDGSKKIKDYRVSFGLWPWHDKVKEGDFRTPLGSFYLCTRNDRSAYHYFMGISYPDPSAADRGWAQGLVTPQEHAQILKAWEQRTCPPWNTGLGGAIGIHGGGALFFHWTRGCIAMDNQDIEELWIACPIGTSVKIEP